MNDDFEESYDDDYDLADAVDDARDIYDDIKDISDKVKDRKNKKTEGKGSNSNPQEEARNFDKQLRDKNNARTKDPNLGSGATKEAGKEVGKEAGKQAGKEIGKEVGKQAGKEVAKQAGKEAAKQAGKEAAKQGTKAAVMTGLGTAEVLAGGPYGLVALGIEVVIDLAIELALLAYKIKRKLQKKLDKKASESGVDTKGLRRLLLISPILLPIAIVFLIILLLVQSETQEKAEFLNQAIVCFEGDKSCSDFMNTGITIPNTGNALIKATDLQIADFVIAYVTAENKYYGSTGSSYLSDLVNDINEFGSGTLDDQKNESEISTKFKGLVEDSIIGDTIYAWHLFKWMKMEKKVYNNIDWYKAYTANRFSKITDIASGIETKLTGAPNIIDDDTVTRKALALDLNPEDSWLATPTSIDTDEAIEVARPYIPSWIELYATYVATGDYDITNAIYDYYVSDKYKLNITLYQLTTVVSTEKIEKEPVTTYEVTRDGKTETLSKKEYEAAIDAGSRGVLSWLGDALANFAEDVTNLAEAVWEVIKELLGFYIKVDTDYTAIVTQGNAFNYKINQEYKIKTDKKEEIKENADSKSESKVKSDFKYIVKTTTTTTTTVPGEYEKSSSGLYVYAVQRNEYIKIRDNAKIIPKYTSFSNPKNKYIPGDNIQVKTDSNGDVIYYNPKKTTTSKTNKTEKTASFKVTTTTNIDYKITTWKNKLEYVSTSIDEYKERNRYAQIFMDMVEDNDYHYTLDDVAIAMEIIESYYDETYKMAGSSIDYSALPEGKFGWPVPANKVVSAIFGYTTWYGDKHGGIDVWAVDAGGNPSASMSLASTVDIVAARDGIVEGVNTLNCADSTNLEDSCGGGYGNRVYINHGDGYKTVYAHLSPGTIKVRNGDKVKAGDYLGKMGSSGNSSGVHLHFEIQYDGNRLDPLAFYNVEPHAYKLPYHSRNNAAITMANPYKVNFDINDFENEIDGDDVETKIDE